MGGKPSKASIDSKPTTTSDNTTSTNPTTPNNNNNNNNNTTTPKVTQTNKPTASQPRISQNDITLIKSTHQSLEALCKMAQPVHVIQEHLDTLFAKVDPRGYKSLVSSQQGARYNLLHPLLRLVVSPGPNTKGLEEDLYNLIKANEYLCPSCSPQLPLFQSLLLYLKRAHSLYWNHEGIKLLLSRIETINIDVLYSVYCTFDDFIQHTVGINTPEQFQITKTLLNFLREQAPKLPIQSDMIPPPYQPYSLTVHHITMIGAKLFHRVQVPPMFYLTRSSVDNAIFREAFEFVCDAYGYDLYNPISGRSTQPMNASLPYPHHCLFHAPVVGGSDHQKSLSRPIINLDNEIINPELAQSRCGSTFTYLSSQNKIFSLDLVVYLLHLAAKDQVRAIKKHHQGQFPPGEDEHSLYKKIAVATKDWLYTLSSSYGVPALATLLHNMLSLHEKVHFSTNSQQTVSKAEFQYEPLSEGAVKFIISMCHTYGDKTLFYDADNRKATQKDKPNAADKFEVLPREQQDEIFYQTVSDIYYYNPFPLMFALRLIPWLYRFTPDYVEDDVFSYIQLFVSQLLPSTFTSPLLLATNSAKAQQTPQILENTTVTTIQDKHKLSLAKYKSLWPESVDALEAYENFDNSLPFYSETTLKLQQLWTLIEHYNYNDITNVQLLFNPFFMTLTFPHFGIYNPQMANITSYLLSLGMLSNFYAKPLFLMNQSQPTRQIKYPTLMMEQAAIGGTGLSKCYIWCYDHSSIASQGFLSGKDSSKFYPSSTYNNPLSFPMQFPAIFSTPHPTSQLLPPAIHNGESYNECAILQQQLAFTRHVLNQMTQNSLNDNITLHLYILNILQVLFFQLHTSTSETQANVVRTQIIVGFNQLKAYIQKSGSLFAQLSAEDKPQQQLHNNYVTSTRSIQSPQARVIEKFAPTPMTHLDFFNSSTRRQEYLKVQLPVLMHTMNLLCSTGLIWTLLLPNLDDLFTAQTLPSRVLDGMAYSNISNIYSMTMLTLFQIFALQAYIIEQQENILSPSKPINAMQGTSSPLLPYPLGENIAPLVPLTPAQELNFTLTTYLCYLPPLPPNVFATSLVGSFFRIADLLIEKLNYIVSASASRKISAQITPLEYFCAIICYQPLVYELSRVQEYFSTTGDIIDTSNTPQQPTDGESTTTTPSSTATTTVKTGQTAGSIAGTGKISHLFGYTIQFEFDSTAYDPHLPPLPEISNSFLWLLYTSKKVERFAYKKDHLDSNLEQLVQQHYHSTLPEEAALVAIHEPVHAPNLPTTPELMFFIDSTITTYNHFSQWSNHYCGWGTPTSTISKNSTHPPIVPKSPQPLVTNFATHSTVSPSYIINDAPPYQSTGLLSFMLDCCSQTNIDDVMVLLQGISPSEGSLEYLRQTSEGIDEDELLQFKIYQPFVDQLNRPITMPVRPYTYTKLNLSQRFYSCDFLFNGLKPQYRNDIMKGFAQLEPSQPDAIDYLHNNNLIEYQSTVGAEIIINAILRRCSDAVLAAIVNCIGKEDLSHVIRPMYIMNPTTGMNESFSLRDFAIAAQTKSYAPALYTSLMQ